MLTRDYLGHFMKQNTTPLPHPASYLKVSYYCLTSSKWMMGVSSMLQNVAKRKTSSSYRLQQFPRSQISLVPTLFWPLSVVDTNDFWSEFWDRVRYNRAQIACNAITSTLGNLVLYGYLFMVLLGHLLHMWLLTFLVLNCISVAQFLKRNWCKTRNFSPFAPKWYSQAPHRLQCTWTLQTRGGLELRWSHKLIMLV